jgi:RNA polymerase sigma-70 factor (ECF subfamily)
MTDSKENSVCKESTFQHIFKTHSADLYRFLYHKYGQEHHPADLVQEAFIKLWKNCEKVLPEKAKAFLFTVANNQMLNEIARRKTAQAYANEQPENFSGVTPEYIMEEEEYRVRLDKALASLSEEQRITFLLNRVEGKRHQEIAEMLGISRKAVEKRIYTALAILREQVDGI